MKTSGFWNFPVGTERDWYHEIGYRESEICASIIQQLVLPISHSLLITHFL